MIPFFGITFTWYHKLKWRTRFTQSGRIESGKGPNLSQMPQRIRKIPPEPPVELWEAQLGQSNSKAEIEVYDNMHMSKKAHETISKYYENLTRQQHASDMLKTENIHKYLKSQVDAEVDEIEYQARLRRDCGISPE